MKYIFLLFIFFSFLVQAKETIRVGIVDTGLDLNDYRFKNLLCDEGKTSKDFTGKGIKDTNSHGTHVAGLIKQYAKDSDYCLVILKFYDDNQSVENNVVAELTAFEYANDLNVSIINYSAGGGGQRSIEYDIIKELKNITFISAAGNSNQNMDILCTFFPACYNLPNVISVGSLSHDGKKSLTSNYGVIIKHWEIGDKVFSTAPCDRYIDKSDCNQIMSGTSQAAAITTGKLIKQRDNDAKIH